MAVWRANLSKLLRMPTTLPMVTHKQPVEKRTGRNRKKEGPTGSHLGRGDNDQEAEDGSLPVQVHHAS